MNVSHLTTDSPLARRKPRTRTEEVMADLRERIAAGELLPGERLATFKELGEHYSVGQATITNAIKRLADRGWVVTRRRSGAYVADPLPEAPPARMSPASSSTQTPGSLSAYYRPVDADRGTLRLYVSELLPANLNLWQRLLDAHMADQGLEAFEHRSCVDGHFQELHQRDPFDVVETTPWVLEASDFPCHERLSPNIAGRRAEELLPIAQAWLKQHGTRYGIPFLATVSYLFVNLDLLEAAGVDPEPPEGGAALLALGAEVDRRLQEKGLAACGMEVGSLQDVLILEGACRCEDQQVILCREKARYCLDIVAAHSFHAGDSNLIGERFISGDLAMLHHASFLAVEVQERAAFRWAMLPLIQPDGLPLPCHLTVLAINAACRSPLAAISLVRYLLSDPVQLELARQFGNVPVVASAALADEVCRAHPAGAAYTRTLAASGSTWTQKDLYTLARCTPLSFLMEDAALQTERMLKRLEFSLSIGFGERLHIE